MLKSLPPTHTTTPTHSLDATLTFGDKAFVGGDFITKGKAKSTVILKGDMSFEGNKNIITTLKTSSPRLTLIDLSYNHQSLASLGGVSSSTFNRGSNSTIHFRLLEIGSKNSSANSGEATGLLGGSYI